VDKNQRLVHMKFLNIVNNEDESIGDFWLGIDNNALMDYRESQTEEAAEIPLSIAVTLSIDENNLVEVTAVLSELPGVELSKTLSRGKADEKLFMDLEAMVDHANEAGYDTYVMDEITRRSADIVADIHKVIDKNTGKVIEPVYNPAKMKIEKTRRMAEEDNCGYPLMFYAEDIIFQFSDIMTDGERGRLQREIDHLKDMNQHGTYEENIQAIRDMGKTLDEFPVLNVLMNIVKAAELCEEHDPGRAPQFSNAMGTIIEAMGRKNKELINKTLDSIMPQVREVLHQYDSQAGAIQKGITR
jgi:molecular chaperone DnaK